MAGPSKNTVVHVRAYLGTDGRTTKNLIPPVLTTGWAEAYKQIITCVFKFIT